MKTLLILLISFVSFAQIPNVNVSTHANGFTDPMQTVSITDNVEITLQRNGKAYITENGIKRTDAIIDIQPTPSTFGEQGALSITYKDFNGIDFVWIYYTKDGDIKKGVIDFWTIDIINNASSLPINIFDGFTATSVIHQGGQLYWIDEFLYCSFGDSNNLWNAQNDTKANGKILRLDPFNYNDTLDIYAKGLRNPFRGFEYNGILFVGDVGVSSYEELDKIENSGYNLAHPFKEGFSTYQTTIPNNPLTGIPYELTNELEPFLVYTHDDTTVITSDEIYDIGFSGRTIIPLDIVEDWGYDGKSIALCDFYRNDLILVDLDTNFDIVNVRNLGTSTQIFFITDGYTKNNDLYLTSISGSIYKFSYESTLSITENTLNNTYNVMYYDMLGREFKSIKNASNGFYIELRFYDNRTETKKIIKR